MEKKESQGEKKETSDHPISSPEIIKISSKKSGDSGEEEMPRPKTEMNLEEGPEMENPEVSSDRNIIKNSSKESSDRGEEEVPRPKTEMNLEEGPEMENPEVSSDRNIIKNSSGPPAQGDESETPKPKKAKNPKKPKEGPLISPPLPEEFKNKIMDLAGPESESTIKLVIEKALTASDVNVNQNRLLIPFVQLKDDGLFFTEEEFDLLQERYTNDKEKTKVPVLFIDLKLDHEYKMNLTRWDMKNSCNYSLLTGWGKVVKKNELKEKDSVQIWGFRKGCEEKLGLALMVTGRGEEEMPSPKKEMNLEEKKSDRGEEEMPSPKKEMNLEEKGGNLTVSSDGIIMKNSSGKRLREKGDESETPKPERQ